MLTNFDNFEFRCSALGKIVSKSGKLTDGVKTELKKIFVEALSGYHEDVYSKAFDKGLYCEEDAITMLGQTLMKGRLLMKNTTRNRNGWIHGEHDVFKDGIVFDVKNAINRNTFISAQLTWDYEWQLIGYYWLLYADKAVLYYSLNNMPPHLLDAEKKSLFYKKRNKYVDENDQKYIKDCEKLELYHTYDHLPLVERFKFWEVEVTPEKIDRLKESIIESRKYLNTLLDEYMDMIEKNSKTLL